MAKCVLVEIKYDNFLNFYNEANFITLIHEGFNKSLLHSLIQLKS